MCVILAPCHFKATANSTTILQTNVYVAFIFFPKSYQKYVFKDPSQMLLGGDSKIGLVNHVNNSANR